MGSNPILTLTLTLTLTLALALALTLTLTLTLDRTSIGSMRSSCSPGTCSTPGWSTSE